MNRAHNYFAMQNFSMEAREAPWPFLDIPCFDTLVHAVKFIVEELGTGAP